MKHSKPLALLLAVIIGSVSSASLANAYNRTITNPADNSSLSSSVMRSELQTLENEITSLFTIGNGTAATSSTLTLSGGVLSTASSTFSSTLHLALSDGLLNVYSGLVSSNATSSWTFASSTLLANSNTFSGTNNFSGNTGFGSTSPGTLLSIGGDGTGINFLDGTTATSTISGNLDIGGNLLVRGLIFAPITLVNSNNLQVTGDFSVLGQTTLATSLTGLLKATSGVVSVAGAGTDYENPLTFNYPLTRSVNAISTAFATTTANTFSLLQIFANASTTEAFSAASETFYINSAGRIRGKNTTTGDTGAMTPTRSFVLGTGTTTTWTASTTASAYSPCMVMPFAGTLKRMRPWTDASFLGVNVTVNGSNATPSYVVASTTIGTVPFTAGNTFTAGQKVCANFGTTTTATTLQAGATFDVTETF